MKWLEDWVFNSIKPIDISCESSMLIGVPDWKVSTVLMDLVPILIVLGILHMLARKVTIMAANKAGGK